MGYTAQTWVDGSEGGTPVSAARLNHIEQGVTTANAKGIIDVGFRTSFFDVQAVGTTQTEVEGLRVVVPPRTAPYLVRISAPVKFLSGTAAVASLHTINMQLQDETNSNAVVQYGNATYVQVTAASQNVNQVITLEQYFEPNATTKYYKITAALTATAVANWTQTRIQAGNLPTAGELFPPIALIAMGV